ncbi:hypothetical protein FVER53590_28411 [Fusarium verticillioides]|nr:hypothetical protein FVER53590_28411 [Fusarium verticillioides]
MRARSTILALASSSQPGILAQPSLSPSPPPSCACTYCEWVPPPRPGTRLPWRKALIALRWFLETAQPIARCFQALRHRSLDP